MLLYSKQLLTITLLVLTYSVLVESSGYQLENTFKPNDYQLHLILPPNFLTAKEFSGVVNITGIVQQNNLKKIHLHIANEIKIFKMSVDEELVDVKTLGYNETTEILEIPTKEFNINQEVQISIEYEGILYEDMNGFYLSSVDQAEMIATTQFQPTYARRAFPCFDEPSFKAYFTVSLTVPPGYKVLSNQPGTELSSFDKMKTIEFLKTPLMSTYLLAFVVCKFSFKNVENNFLPMTIWSPRSSIQTAQFASEVSYKILETLSNHLNNVGSGGANIAFDRMGIKQLDQIAVPDFAAGAMENWGLVTYKQNKLLWSNGESPLKAKEVVARVIAHEFTHNWFGNLVTTGWWSTTWLNEAFANYFEYHGLKGVAVMNDYNLEEQFLVEEVCTIMEVDGGEGGALTSQAESPSEIRGKFSAITYSKGGAIVRMLRKIVGEDFMKNLNEYVDQFQNKAVGPSDLLNNFPQRINQITVKQLMTNWLEKPGYPIVDVTTTSTTTDKITISISQKPFTYQDLNKTTEWYIPIWYINYNLVSGATYNSDLHLLKPGSPLTLTLPNDKDTLTLVNPQKMGYYRVNYDLQTWNNIMNVLKTNLSIVEPVVKANLIDDVMNLARAGHLEYKTAFNLLSYLKDEVEYIPWKAAMNAFSYLQKTFQNDDALWKILSNRIDLLMFKLWENYRGFHVDPKLTPIQVYTKVLLMEWSCLLDKVDCIKDANDLWSNSLSRARPIDANLRGIVYCSVLRSSEDTNKETQNWNILWQKYLDSKVANAKDVILTALGCTENEELIKKLLRNSLNREFIRLHDLTNVFKAVLEGSPNNVNVTIRFLDSEFGNIPRVYLSKILDLLGDRVSTDDNLSQFEKFIIKHHQELSEEVDVDSVINTAKFNINWKKSNKESIIRYLSRSCQNSLNFGLFLGSLIMIVKNYGNLE